MLSSLSSTMSTVLANVKIPHCLARKPAGTIVGIPYRNGNCRNLGRAVKHPGSSTRDRSDRGCRRRFASITAISRADLGEFRPGLAAASLIAAQPDLRISLRLWLPFTDRNPLKFKLFSGGRWREAPGYGERPMKEVIAAFALATTPMLATHVGAQETSPFFAGKTVRIVVGFSAGGGYDIYARELARYLGQHIPGHPAVVVQNMAGAGSLKAVNFLFNAAPRDGTALATLPRGIVFDPPIGHLDGAQLEAPKFTWIGSISDETGVCAINAPRGVATWQDMLTTKTVIGASGAGADSDVFPIVLRNLFHLPMRIVTGYPGGADVNLAMERGEIDGRCGWSWTSILSRNREWLTEKRI